MPQGGHNRKPTVIKVLEGNPGKRQLPEREPKPMPVAPTCPKWLPRAAKNLWNELAPQLERIGLLTAADGQTFASLCLHWSLMREAAEDIAKRGTLVPSAREDGAMVKNPSLQVLRENSAAFRGYAQAFGLDPQARSRISLPPEPEKDDGMGILLSGLRIGRE